jgi:hypothetical protein
LKQSELGRRPIMEFNEHKFIGVFRFDLYRILKPEIQKIMSGSILLLHGVFILTTVKQSRTGDVAGEHQTSVYRNFAWYDTGKEGGSSASGNSDKEIPTREPTHVPAKMIAPVPVLKHGAAIFYQLCVGQCIGSCMEQTLLI